VIHSAVSQLTSRIKQCYELKTAEREQMPTCFSGNN